VTAAEGALDAPGGTDALDATVRDLLVELSTAFATRDVERLVRQFSGRADVLYAGSEEDEQAVGPEPLRVLLAAVLARPETYAFEFRECHVVVVGESATVIATGTGMQTSPAALLPAAVLPSAQHLAECDVACRLPHGLASQRHPRREPNVVETFGYRVVGTLIVEDERWVWLVLSGSEPTPAL